MFSMLTDAANKIKGLNATSVMRKINNEDNLAGALTGSSPTQLSRMRKSFGRAMDEQAAGQQLGRSAAFKSQAGAALERFGTGVNPARPNAGTGERVATAAARGVGVGAAGGAAMDFANPWGLGWGD